MSDEAKALGMTNLSVEYQGQRFKLSPFTVKDYGEYTLFLEESLWRAVQRAGTLKWLQPHEYKDAVDRALLLCGTHKLSYGTEAFVASTATLPGLQKLLELSLRHENPGVTEEDCFNILRGDIEGIAKIVKQLMDESV